MPVDTFEAAINELEPMRALIREMASLMHTIQVNGGVSTREEDQQFAEIVGRLDAEARRIIALVPLVPHDAVWRIDWLRLQHELVETWRKLFGKVSPEPATALEQAARTWGGPVVLKDPGDAGTAF